LAWILKKQAHRRKLRELRGDRGEELRRKLFIAAGGEKGEAAVGLEEGAEAL